MRSLLLTFVGVSAVAAQARPSTEPAQGYTYTLTTTQGAGRRGITGGPGTQSYVAHATVLGSRGRMDIVEGNTPLFAKGDYILFDSTEIVVVHPSTQTFNLVTEQTVAAVGQGAFDSTIKVSDESVALDLIGPGDTISGFPTTHYRMRLGFNMASLAMPIRLGSEAVTDYWVATIPGMGPNPMLGANSLGHGAGGVPGVLRALSLRVDSAATRMGRTIVLRSASATRITLGQGDRQESQTSTLVSDIKRAPVDRNYLIVPIQYKVAPLPGMSADSLSDGAKWKAPPPGE
jgi:hypothetical protein